MTNAPNAPLLIAVIVIASLLTIGIDWLMRGRLREGLVNGMCLSALAFTGLVMVWTSNTNLHSPIAILAIGALIIMALIGGTMVVQNDIDDQESGQMSKWGTWWDSFDNNYFENVLGKWSNVVAIGVVFVVTIYMAINAAFETTSAQPTVSRSSMNREKAPKAVHAQHKPPSAHSARSSASRKHAHQKTRNTNNTNNTK